MNVWVIAIGEPLPIDAGKPRLLRSGLIANTLADRGHSVTWWTSSFDHVLKQDRTCQDEVVQVSEKLRIYMLYASGYRKNVSVARIVNHLALARRFSSLSRREARPDIILTSFPSIALSAAATAFGRANSVPVVVDIRDLWPDIFLDLFPGFLHGLARTALIPAFHMARKTCRQATAITGITSPFVKWGLKNAGRGPEKLDREFLMGYSSKVPSAREIAQASEYWQLQGISEGREEFIVCFCGYLGQHFDLETVIRAARQLREENKRSIRFVFCGTGEKLDHYKQLAAGCGNILFPGWIDFPKIWFLLQKAAVGLAPYKNIKNFTLNLPNKPAEYFSAALPVLTSLKGLLSELLAETDTGLAYEENNPDDLIDKLIFLYDNPEKRRTMAQNSLLLYENQFKAETVYEALADYLEKIGKARRQ